MSFIAKSVCDIFMLGVWAHLTKQNKKLEEKKEENNVFCPIFFLLGYHTVPLPPPPPPTIIPLSSNHYKIMNVIDIILATGLRSAQGRADSLAERRAATCRASLRIWRQSVRTEQDSFHRSWRPCRNSPTHRCNSCHYLQVTGVVHFKYKYIHLNVFKSIYSLFLEWTTWSLWSPIWRLSDDIFKVW